MSRLISCTDHGVYGVSPEDCPLCPCCDQPMWVGERITLQTVDAGSGQPDLLRLVHSDCVEDDEDTESADSSSTAGNEGGGESSSASSPSPSSEINKEWLVTVWKTLSAAVGPDPQVIENQAIALADSAKLQNEATRKKAGTIKASLKRVCEGAELGGELEYCAGVIGVDPKELAGGLV